MDRPSAHAHFGNFTAALFFLCFAFFSGVPAQENGGFDVFRTKPRNGPDVLIGTPIQFPSNASISCADLNSSSAPALLQITQDWELRLDSPATGNYPATVTVLGGMPENPNLSVGLALSGSSITSWSLNWIVPEAQDSKVSAVILSSPLSGSTVYSYSQLASSDSGRFNAGEGSSPVTRVSLCFEQFTVASDASAFVMGRVRNPYGRPLSRVLVTLFDLSTNDVHYTLTNPFGYYRFTGLSSSDQFLMSVRHRRYLFLSASVSFSLENNITNMNFQASQ